MLETRVETAPGGQRLRIARLGDGPPLVLLHGYPDNLQIWTALAPRLAGRHGVITIDWPGMGGSDAWDGGATPVHMADRLLALVDHWGLEKVTLLGMDMGGQPTLAFAARHPERTERIVVMNSLVLADEPTSWDRSPASFRLEPLPAAPAARRRLVPGDPDVAAAGCASAG
jgi:pimeloyl-ACP methyl ester carboxylesterase